MNQILRDSVLFTWHGRELSECNDNGRSSMEPGAIRNQPEITEIFSNQNKRNAIRIFTEKLYKPWICFNLYGYFEDMKMMFTQRSLEHE
jgi:hypothetical protein